MDACETIDQERLTQMRLQIVETLLEIDNINLQVNPRILAQYAKSIGYLENDLCKWQLKARRAKRKFALAQAAANKGEKVSLQGIEETLDDEFAEWEAQVSKQMADQLSLLETLAGSRMLSPSCARELKALHKKLIKRLHPDLHPSLPAEGHRFFLIAQSAYENGDLDALRAVDTATEDYEQDAIASEATADELEIEIVMTEAQLNIAIERLEMLKKSHPFILTELLDDPIKLAQKRKGIEEEIERLREATKAYEAKIASLDVRRRG